MKEKEGKRTALHARTAVPKDTHAWPSPKGFVINLSTVVQPDTLKEITKTKQNVFAYELQRFQNDLKA